jgi:hypothetical protein
MNAQPQLQTTSKLYDAITNDNVTEVALLLQGNPYLVSEKGQRWRYTLALRRVCGSHRDSRDAAGPGADVGDFGVSSV